MTRLSQIKVTKYFPKILKMKYAGVLKMMNLQSSFSATKFTQDAGELAKKPVDTIDSKQ